MCIGCWHEIGSPEPSEAAKALMRTILEHEELAPAGGNLHIVTDDFNCSDEDLQWCAKNFGLTPKEKEVFDGLLPLTESDRIAALAYAAMHSFEL